MLGTRLDSLSNRVRKDDGSRKCSLIPSFMCEMLVCVCCFLKLAFPKSSGCAIFFVCLATPDVCLCVNVNARVHDVDKMFVFVEH